MNKELKENLEKDLRNKIVSSRVLLNSFSMIDESSRLSGAYDDPTFIPFFYYLGKWYKSKSLLEIGFNIGICSGCYLKSCKETERFVAFQEISENYFPNIGIKNIKKIYKNNFNFYMGNSSDESFESLISDKFDLILINQRFDREKFKFYIDFCWNYLNEDGIMVCDYINENNKKDVFNSFNYYINDRFYLKTRYGIAIIRK